MNRKIMTVTVCFCRTAVALCLVVLTLAFAGCNANEEDSIKEDPYAGGREPLAVKLLSETPDPETAGPGEEVVFRTEGLAKYIHREGDTYSYDFQFYISDEICEIAAATDTTLTAVIPQNVSSGSTYMVLENQIFYGPYFNVSGSVSIDEGFEYYKTGPYMGVILSCVPWSKNTSQVTEFYLCGDFYKASNSKNYGGLAMVSSETGAISYGTADKFKVNNGIYAGSYYVENMGEFLYCKVNGLDYWKEDNEETAPRVIMYGLFSDYEKYYTNLGGQFTCKNLLLLNSDLSVKTEKKKFSDSNGTLQEINVPVFVGGTGLGYEIVRAFAVQGKKIIAVGNFDSHCKTDYDNSTCNVDKDKLIASDVYTEAKSVMRMDENGELDMTYRRDAASPETKSKEGAVGHINDACLLKDESVIMVGEITQFDGQTVHNLVKIDAQGNIEPAFLANVNAGTDSEISKITHTVYTDVNGEEQERIVITGNFTSFNGQKVSGLVVLNPDGTLDPDFVLHKEDGQPRLEGGMANFAKIVDLTPYSAQHSPYLVVTGTFDKYDGVTRQGFLILDMEGNAIQKFNVPGRFSGQLHDAQYSLTSDNANGLLLTGNFFSFDGKEMNNIVMLKIELQNVVEETEGE
ncbi:DUF5008 domain-containing protein [uncultured Bacteroides sp.]|uniref:DUF5008 domain-containing protein n=1 Tax=uncultured Bacteroides sp. TaxID=162156 RepID=UPI002675ABB8|nr:DUF5008 domain-containing protein [uncultured Bacteroides sp.]